MHRWSDLVRMRTADNPGPMTLTGTNSYLLAAPGATGAVLVDPGPDDPVHLRELAAASRVELILLTHRHADHTGGVDAVHRHTGAPVRAVDPAWCRAAAPLVDGETIAAAGVVVTVLATPGHTSDSACFDLAGDGVFTGDTVLGSGTTMIDHPDGTLRDYLDSLRRLETLGPRPVRPAHGPQRDDLAALSREYLDHRLDRLDQIRAALAALGPGADAAAVTDAVYPDVPPGVRPAAALSVAAQLRHLRG